MAQEDDMALILMMRDADARDYDIDDDVYMRRLAFALYFDKMRDVYAARNFRKCLHISRHCADYIPARPMPLFRRNWPPLRRLRHYWRTDIISAARII